MKVFVAILALAALVSAIPHQIKPAGVPVYFLIHRQGPNRIVGGEEAAPHSSPHQVGLWIPYEDGRAFCGGSLLTENWVVTAAHCGELSQNITVVLGAHNINEAEDTQKSIESELVIVHPNWDSTTLENDIALIKLSTPVELDENINVIALPKRSQAENPFAGVEGTATGWGIVKDGDTAISPVLNTVTTNIMTNGQCRIAFGLIGALLPLHPSNVCTDGAEGKSTCSGDSGGPLTVLDNHGNRTLVGLTSFGVSLGCEAGYPAVFTRITSFLDWVSLETGIEIQP